MRDLKPVAWTLAAALALIAVTRLIPAHAVPIEGFAPSGNFLTVGVDEQGRLMVTTAGDIFTSTAGHITTTDKTFAGVTAGLALSSNTMRRGSGVCNNGDADVRVAGLDTVTPYAGGWLLRGGSDACVSFDIPSFYQGPLYTNATGPYTVTVAELTP